MERAMIIAAGSAVDKAAMVIKRYPNIKEVTLMTYCD